MFDEIFLNRKKAKIPLNKKVTDKTDLKAKVELLLICIKISAR